jgi:septum formation protein
VAAAPCTEVPVEASPTGLAVSEEYFEPWAREDRAVGDPARADPHPAAVVAAANNIIAARRRPIVVTCSWLADARAAFNWVREDGDGLRLLADEFRLWHGRWTGTIAMAQPGKLILASGSPRRRELLSRAAVEFEVVESGIPEHRLDHEEAAQYALRMASEKALAVARRRAGALVLAADTVVEIGGEILEKPVDAEDARRMLNRLSGRTHTVVTAFAIARDGAVLEKRAVLSRVTFRELSAREIDEYIATGEPFDKAGAYGIQALGGSFIARVEGSRENVMGLPVCEVVEALQRHGVVECRAG